MNVVFINMVDGLKGLGGEDDSITHTMINHPTHIVFNIVDISQTPSDEGLPEAQHLFQKATSSTTFQMCMKCS